MTDEWSLEVLVSKIGLLAVDVLVRVFYLDAHLA